jgi:hypothetical protein
MDTIFSKLLIENILFLISCVALLKKNILKRFMYIYLRFDLIASHSDDFLRLVFLVYVEFSVVLFFLHSLVLFIFVP